MTVPFVTQDYIGDMNRQRELFEQELAAYSGNRDRLVSSFMGGGQQQGPVQGAAVAPATSAWHDEDLVAAAGFWGMPEQVARSMPKEALLTFVNQKRSDSRAEGTSTLAAIAAPLAMFGVGAAEAVTGGLQHIPFIGEWMAHQAVVHDADQAVRQMAEGVRASVSQGMGDQDRGHLGPFSANVDPLSLAEDAGQLAALWVPTGAIFRMAEGVAGVVPLVGRTAIGRAAFAGGASAYLLEGGSQEFKDHPVAALAFGATLGAGFKALEPMVMSIAGRLAKRFVPADALSPEPLQGPRTGVPGTPYFGPEPLPETPYYGPGQAVVGSLADMEIPVDIPHTGAYRDNPFDFLLSPTQPKAEGLAAQMNKVGAVMESPALPELSSRPAIGEETVVTAQQATNPGGTNILQGVSDPQALAQQFKGIRFARRGNRLDALMGDNITDAQVAQYEQFGLYTGQHVLDKQGNETVVSLLFNHPTGAAGVGRVGMAETTVPASIGLPPRIVQTSELTPLISSTERADVPEIWDAFQQYADARAYQTNTQIGASLAPEHVIATRQTQLQQYLAEFLDRAGVKSAGDRARVSQYLNDRFVEGYAAVAPEEAARMQGILQFTNSVVPDIPLSSLANLDRAAATKGMIAVPDGRTGTVRLMTPAESAQPGPEIPMGSIDEAHGFLRTLNRDLPDITPPSHVPLELANGLPTEATQEAGSFLNDTHLAQAAQGLDAGGAGTIPPHGGGPPTGGAGGGPPEGPWEEEVKGLVDKGRLIEAQQRLTEGVAKWRPMSILIGEWDSMLREHGLNLDLFKDYSQALEAHDLSVTWKAPWQREIGTILADARRSIRDNGTWTRVWQVADPGKRIELALKSGMNSKEIASLHEADAFLDRMLGPGASQEIAGYVSHVAEQQSRGVGDAAWEGFDHQGPAQNLAAVYGKSTLNMRDVSPDLLFAHVIGAEGWTRYVDGVYNPIKDRWAEIGKVAPDLQPISSLFGNWLKSMRFGYEPIQSTALDAGHVLLQGMFGPEVTQQQARSFFAGGLSMTQQALLGFKPHVIVRDGLRLMFALPKQGADLIATVGTFLKGDDSVKEAMWKFATERGIVTQQSTSIHPPGYFEAPALEGATPLLSGEGGSLRHKVAQALYYNVADNLPSWLRDPTPGKLSPLYWVSKQAEMMRMLVGNAQYAKTVRALGNFRAAGEGASTDTLMGESAIRTLPDAVQNTFLQHVASGNDEAAATFAARHMVDNTMFRYGHLESPLVARSISGRIALQLGSFGLHTWQYLRTGLQEGTLTDKAKLVLGFGGLSAALWAAQEKTGWKFLRMSPLHGIGFTGGPWLEPAVEELANLGGTFQYMQGTDTPTNKRGFDQLLNAPGRALAMVNPLTGLMRGAQAVGTATNSPSPGMSLLRYITTGEVTNTPDVEQMLAPQASAAFQASLHPMSNPMRADSFGTQDFMSQVPVSPAGVKSPLQQYQEFMNSLPQPGRP